MLDVYKRCIDSLTEGEPDKLGDHNLVLSRHFLWIVQRKAESFEQDGRRVLVNSLGMTGHLAVKRE